MHCLGASCAGFAPMMKSYDVELTSSRSATIAVPEVDSGSGCRECEAASYTRIVGSV